MFYFLEQLRAELNKTHKTTCAQNEPAAVFAGLTGCIAGGYFGGMFWRTFLRC